MTPKVGSSDRSILLPGSVQPLEETIVYARANGYVRKWRVDMGDKVIVNIRTWMDGHKPPDRVIPSML